MARPARDSTPPHDAGVDADARWRAEPLALRLGACDLPSAFSGARGLRFELSSRGDRVPGRLLLPDAPGPHPVVLLQHGAGGSIGSPYMEACAPWVRGGAAVASIDFPLHGARASAKLSERLLLGFEKARRREPHGLSATDALLWSEFVRQATFDLARTLDALAELEEIDADRVAYSGFSLGGILGAHFCARDPRPRAAALALAGGGFGPPEVDPCRVVARIAPRPVLMVNARSDETVPRSATEALYEAAAEPKRLEWFDGDHGRLPGIALKAMWSFLREPLGLSD